MNSNKRCELPGNFSAAALGGGAWRLIGDAVAPVELFLRGIDAPAIERLRAAPASEIEILWEAGSAVVTGTFAGRRYRFAAASAIVHQPLPHLYEALPLAQPDAASRSFWRRVFGVARLPGGRWLLGALARGARGAR